MLIPDSCFLGPPPFLEAAAIYLHFRIFPCRAQATYYVLQKGEHDTYSFAPSFFHWQHILQSRARPRSTNRPTLFF